MLRFVLASAQALTSSWRDLQQNPVQQTNAGRTAESCHTSQGVLPRSAALQCSSTGGLLLTHRSTETLMLYSETNPMDGGPLNNSWFNQVSRSWTPLAGCSFGQKTTTQNRMWLFPPCVTRILKGTTGHLPQTEIRVTIDSHRERNRLRGSGSFHIG